MGSGIDGGDMSVGLRCGHRFRTDVWLAVVGVVVGIGVLSGGLCFLTGLACVRPVVFVFCVLPLSVAVVFYCVIRLIVRLIRQWSVVGSKVRLLRVAVVFLAGILIVTGSVVFVVDRPFLRGFVCRVEGKVNLGVIQSWVAEIESVGYKNGDEVVGDDWPEDVRSLRPRCVRVVGPPFAEGTQVCMIWGGGFGHWGLVVGPAAMETPVAGEDGLQEYVEIAPGVYAWEEL